MGNIFNNATLCGGNCTTADYTAPQIDLCAGRVTATKKAKVIFFHCSTPNTDLASAATINALITAAKARLVFSEEFALNYAAITTTIDPKQPDQTTGYNFDMTFKDNRWYSTASFANIDQYNQIADRIQSQHVLFVDEDDEMYLFRTPLGITMLNQYLSGENDKKMIDFSVKGKYYVSATQPHLNKPTIVAGLYASLYTP